MKFKGAKYSGKLTKTFKITIANTALKTAENVAEKSIKVTWMKKSNVTGYIVVIKDSKGKIVSKKKINKSNSTGTSVAKLKKGKTYKVTIQTYLTASGKTYYGTLSKEKKVVINK